MRHIWLRNDRVTKLRKLPKEFLTEGPFVMCLINLRGPFLLILNVRDQNDVFDECQGPFVI